MAVIAVGDFDPARIEAQIKTHFNRVKKPSSAPARTIYDVAPYTPPTLPTASDREATTADVNLIYKLPAHTTRNVGDYRRDLIVPI